MQACASGALTPWLLTPWLLTPWLLTPWLLTPPQDGKLSLPGPQQQLGLTDKAFIDDVLKGCVARLAREAAAADASPMQYVAGEQRLATSPAARSVVCR
jgi:hypothetical protein